MFGLVGLALLGLGCWGLRSAADLGAVPTLDEKAQARRRGTIRRGAVTCLGLGALFVLSAVLAVLNPPPGR